MQRQDDVKPLARLQNDVSGSETAYNRWTIKETVQPCWTEFTVHRQLAIQHLGLRAFLPAEHMRAGILLAARAAFDTDDGVTILQRLTSDMRAQRLVLPSADTLERIGLAGRARARRVSAQAINDALDGERKRALTELLKHDPSIGRSRLTWLRALPHSTSAASMQGLLERLKHVRTLGLPRDLGEAIHPARLAKFAREGAVAPLTLLNDFGEPRGEPRANGRARRGDRASRTLCPQNATGHLGTSFGTASVGLVGSTVRGA